ncbi:ATP-binding protein [Chitinophaga agri]|uniref:histidine kinase n=1 Tax=Chitinophaga agri TaxID=2703787 RepID=A0A6B9ZE92_9BACT|nr:ATP-binding protein [Chitinophaga agri]QHS59634.1 sensor histidine kinase [Chitinophaga agri]
MKTGHANDRWQAVADAIEEWLLHRQAATVSILSAPHDKKEKMKSQVYKQSSFSDCGSELMSRQVWSVHSPQIVEENAHVTSTLALPIINYVKVYLENILFNLIDDAMMCTRTGMSTELTVCTWKEEGRIVWVVEDNGIGIDLKKHQEQLFRYKKKFHRGYESNGTSPYKIRNQVRTFAGNIEVKSEIEKGSSFYVYFNNREYTLQQDE